MNLHPTTQLLSTMNNTANFHPTPADRGREREGEAAKAEAAQEGQVQVQLLRHHHLRIAILRQERGDLEDTS